MNKERYDAAKVFEAAERVGYLHVLGQLAGDVLGKLISNPNERDWCPNPAHKQKSGKAFRLLKDVDHTGGCVCNTCGTFPNIVKTLEFIHDWDYPTILKEIALVVGVEPEPEYDIKELFTNVRKYGDMSLMSELSEGRLPADLKPGMVMECPCCHKGQLKIEKFGQSVCSHCGKQENLTKTMELVMGWDYEETIGRIANYLDVDPINGVREFSPRAKQAKRTKPVIAPKYSEEEIQKNKEKLKKAITSALPLKKQEARQILANYLQSRGLDFNRLLPKLNGRVWVNPKQPYYEEVIKDKKSTYVKRGEFPALLILFYNKENNPINIHRIYLEPNGFGKLKLSGHDGKPLDVKKSMVPAGEMNGGYMAISEVTSNIMAVAEGYETSLVPEQVFGFQTRAASAGLAKSLTVPDHVDKVLFFADPDAAGISAAEDFHDRMVEMGKLCLILYPPTIEGRDDADWLDALNHYGERYIIDYTKDLLSQHKKKAA